MTPLERLERKSRLWHVEQSVSSILRYSSGRTADDLRTDRMFRMAVERELIIIGEALARALGKSQSRRVSKSQRGPSGALL